MIRNMLWGIMLISLVSCKETRKEPAYYQTNLSVFATEAHIKYYYHKDLGKEIVARLDSFDLSLNPFNDRSIIYKVNNNRAVEVDNWFITCFNKAQEIAAITDGIYDITVAPLINLWGFGFEGMSQVTSEKIDSVRQFVGYEKVRLHGRKIVKDDLRLQLNASSLAKGYACDVIAELFDGYGIEHYMIEIGGEIRAKGKNPNNDYWTIAITTPVDDRSGSVRETQEVVYLKDCSLATSGNYRNYYLKDGIKYAHTINPKTGYPAQGNILSASVFYPDCMTADAYATAFMALGLEKAVALAERMPDMNYLFIYDDGEGNLKEIRSVHFAEKYLIK